MRLGCRGRPQGCTAKAAWTSPTRHSGIKAWQREPGDQRGFRTGTTSSDAYNCQKAWQSRRIRRLDGYSTSDASSKVSLGPSDVAADAGAKLLKSLAPPRPTKDASKLHESGTIARRFSVGMRGLIAVGGSLRDCGFASYWFS